MIAHVVLMKPRPDLSAGDRQSFADAFRRAVHVIPDVRDVTIGRRVRHGAAYEALPGADAEFIAILTFDDLAGLRAYLSHPSHETLGAKFSECLSAASAYDFECGGLDELARLIDSLDEAASNA